MKWKKYGIRFSPQALEQCQLRVFTDASLGNNHDGTTQGGVFKLKSDSNSQIPLFWQSKKLKRVAFKHH